MNIIRIIQVIMPIWVTIRCQTSALSLWYWIKFTASKLTKNDELRLIYIKLIKIKLVQEKKFSRVIMNNRFIMINKKYS